MTTRRTAPRRGTTRPLDGSDLHRLARTIRELATATTSDPEEGAGPAEVIVGMDVFTHSPTTVSAITRRTGIAQSQVSTVIASMREAGIVTAERDPADRRRTLLSVAPEARRRYGRERGERDPRRLVREHLEREGLASGEGDVEAVLRLLGELSERLQGPR